MGRKVMSIGAGAMGLGFLASLASGHLADAYPSYALVFWATISIVGAIVAAAGFATSEIIAAIERKK